VYSFGLHFCSKQTRKLINFQPCHANFSTSTPTVCSSLRVFDIGLSTDIRLHSNLSYCKAYAEGNNMNLSDRRGDFLAL